MPALSASAATRLRNALESWTPEGSPFNVHLMEGGQDEVFAEILDHLDRVVQESDEPYQSWWELERALDGERDYANQVAFIERALG